MSNMTFDDIKRDADWRFRHRRKTVKQYAKWLEQNAGDRFEVRLEDWSYTPDKTPDANTRWDGKTVHGYRLEVYRKGEHRYPIFTHNTTDSYRRNYEIARGIVQLMTDQP